MDNTDRILCMAQDMASIQAWMLTLLHGLETGSMPKYFVTFNDDILAEYASRIETEVSKRGVDVPD